VAATSWAMVHLIDVLLLAVLPEAPYPRLIVPLRVEAFGASELLFSEFRCLLPSNHAGTDGLP
jgi:hypothetical protein